MPDVSPSPRVRTNSPSFTYIAMAMVDYARTAFSPANVGTSTLHIVTVNVDFTTPTVPMVARPFSVLLLAWEATTTTMTLDSHYNLNSLKQNKMIDNYLTCPKALFSSNHWRRKPIV